MGLVDALSRKDEIDTNDDNQEIALLKGGDQYFHICTLDTILADKISLSSAIDPIVTKALTPMNDKSREPWIPRTAKFNWKFMDGALYIKH